jgi:RHS repeat-associated protein
MQQNHTIPSERNTMSRYGILKVCFDAFSSKKRRGTTPANIYEQFCYADFIHFSFTGKERDEETGYGYFGARYMDHELMTMWLSVDPLADKYPAISPYAYCAWNPVKLVDPDGKETIENDDWYRNNVGDIVWDESVKGPGDLPEDCSYLGEKGVGVNEQGDITRVYNSDGTIDDISQTLPQVDITDKGKRKSAEVAAKIPFALSVALYDGPELGPADAVAILGSLWLSVYATTLWVMEEISTPLDEKSNIQQYEEHTRGARNSTWDKHTQKRPGQVTGQQRNDNRGNKNRKFQPKPNSNKKKK